MSEDNDDDYTCLTLKVKNGKFFKGPDNIVYIPGEVIDSCRASRAMSTPCRRSTTPCRSPPAATKKRKPKTTSRKKKVPDTQRNLACLPHPEDFPDDISTIIYYHHEPHECKAPPKKKVLKRCEQIKLDVQQPQMPCKRRPTCSRRNHHSAKSHHNHHASSPKHHQSHSFKHKNYHVYNYEETPANHHMCHQGHHVGHIPHHLIKFSEVVDAKQLPDGADSGDDSFQRVAERGYRNLMKMPSRSILHNVHDGGGMTMDEQRPGPVTRRVLASRKGLNGMTQLFDNPNQSSVSRYNILN